MSKRLITSQRLPDSPVLFSVIHKQDVKPQELFAANPCFEYRNTFPFLVPPVGTCKFSHVGPEKILENSHVEPPSGSLLWKTRNTTKEGSAPTEVISNA